jgi:hypothetical protein
MDRAAIFAEVLRRNTLRREARLPALNVTEEYQFAVALATWKEFEAICDQHRDLHNEIRAAVIQELRDECVSRANTPGRDDSEAGCDRRF